MGHVLDGKQVSVLFSHTLLKAMPLLSLSSVTHTHHEDISKSNVVNFPGTNPPPPKL